MNTSGQYEEGRPVSTFGFLNHPVFSRKVIIYIANTPNEAWFSNVVTWLSDQDDPDLRETLDRISNDLENFPSAVDSEVLALRKVCGDVDATTHFVVVTTATLLAGYLDIQMAGTEDRLKVPFSYDLPDTASRVQPLMSAETIDCVLKNISAFFDPDLHEFILITKSHGNSRLAMTSLMAGKLDIEDTAKLTKALKIAYQNNKEFTQ